MKGSRETKIFVSAYACEPNLGSEIGVGWNWVLQMSRFFELWVLTRESNKETIEQWLKAQPKIEGLNFVYYDIPKKYRFWKKGLRGVRIYYVLWQLLSNSIVKRTMKENNIGIYHLLTYGNALWPASRFGQKRFFIWGPVGLGEVIPPDYSIHYGPKGRAIEYMRRLMVYALPLNLDFMRRCKDANIIFCKTAAALECIPKRYKEKATIFTDVAVDKKNVSEYLNRTKKASGKVHYLAVGRLDAWRGFDLLIEAFAKAVECVSDIHLHILGDGTDKRRLVRLVSRLGVEEFVSWGGQVAQDVYYKQMAESDVIVNPCLKEGAVTTSFDSISFGKPLICVETGGYTRYFNNECAVVVPRSSRNQVVLGLFNGIVELADCKQRTVKVNKAKEMAEKLDWQSKGDEIFREISIRYTDYCIK